MRIFGLHITRTKSTPPLVPPDSWTGGGGGGWYPIVREPYTGAWQRNDELRADGVLAYFAVFACVTLICSDIGKLTLRLVEQDPDDPGIWTEIESPAFSPVLRKPNRYQTTKRFVESWLASKLIHGNTYALKERDRRGVVVALYVLNPCRVKVLIAPDGSVYYELRSDQLANIPEGSIIVPASEIIHDPMITLFHPLVGVTPIYACGLAATTGLKIQGNSANFFGNGAMPGGVLLAPGAISDATAKRVTEYWNSNFSGANVGKVAALGDGLKYEQMHENAVDAQLIEQLKFSAENCCSCYHVPAWMIGVGPQPPYAHVEPLVQQYYAQCLQSLTTSFETALDEGIGIGRGVAIDGRTYGTEFDVDDLIWMDTATRTQAAKDAISGGALSPNEARRKYYGVGPVEGGDSPMVQQQWYSLAALAARDAADPFAKPTPAAPPATPPNPPPTADAVKSAIRRRLREVA